MTIQVDAIYKNGAFRPSIPVTLEEGARVVLTIDTDSTFRPPQPLVAALIEIAALPVEGSKVTFSGADHDKVLYGSEGAR
jgi:predicted DNA-binding antitoxin AbrB/MazE fold protein